MPFVRVVQIGLIKDERHSQNPFPKVDRALPVGPGKSDVMHPECLDFLHDIAHLCLNRALKGPLYNSAAAISRHLCGLAPFTLTPCAL
ncbi:hypothetical protein XMM354_003317 [Aliiroseovarius sp. xm-m-354]|nr:hypothetical protein [Aliiroseovarius sp. xm-m-354]